LIAPVQRVLLSLEAVPVSAFGEAVDVMDDGAFRRVGKLRGVADLHNFECC